MKKIIIQNNIITHCKFLFSLLWANKLKCSLILLTFTPIYFILDIPLSTTRQVTEVKKTHNNSYYMHIGDHWEYINDQYVIKGNMLTQSNSNDIILYCVLYVLICGICLFIYIETPYYEWKYWNLYEIITQNYGDKVEVFIEYRYGREFVIYTLNGYFIYGSDDYQIDKERIFEFYFNSEMLVKYQDIRKNRINLINSIING